MDGFVLACNRQFGHLGKAVACRAEKRSAACGRYSDVFMAQRSKKARKKQSAADFFGNRKRCFFGVAAIEKNKTIEIFISL